MTTPTQTAKQRARFRKLYRDSEYITKNIQRWSAVFKCWAPCSYPAHFGATEVYRIAPRKKR